MGSTAVSRRKYTTTAAASAPTRVYAAVHAWSTFSGLTFQCTVSAAMYTAPINNMALTGGQIRHYYMEVTTGQIVLCSTNGPNGDADLYMRVGDQAVPDSAFAGNACSSDSGTSMESCSTAAALAPTRVYAAVHAWSTFSGLTFQCTVRAPTGSLSIIEDECQEEASNETTNDLRVYKERNERRQRSCSLAQTQQIRDIIAKTVEELSGEQFKGSWEERLQNALAEAKESGYSSERIFAILGKKGPEEGKSILVSSFVEGLGKLGLKWRDDKELALITDRFRADGNGMISLSKIQNYCFYEVPSVAWKAERQRLEVADSSVEDTAGNDAVEDGSRFDIKEIIYRVGPEFHRTSKLFWRQNVSVNITLRYCKDLDVITMQLQNAETGEEYETIFIRKSDCAVDQGAPEERATSVVQTSDEKVHWEVYSNYLVARLQMNKVGGSYQPRLGNLHGDESSTLEIQKPANLIAPKRIERQSAGLDVKSIDAEFQSAIKSFEHNSRSARTSRQSAQEMSYLVESALKEILEEDSHDASKNHTKNKSESVGARNQKRG
ncbi:hypothetical protein ACHAW5_000109 [Stephanodiscus triporus]|uniref:Calmodulin n=1 Tax=Stephanodiscus triporus TaxID=2934178 RepID=A0ABD3N5P8_9STRA